MKIATSDLSIKSPYIFNEDSYDLHYRNGNISQYDFNRNGLYMFNQFPIYVYGVYTIIVGGVSYDQYDQISFGNCNWIDFKSQSDIKVYLNDTALSVNLQHNYHSLRISASGSSTLRVIAKYY